MPLRHSTWVVALALAIIIVVSGQVRALDACAEPTGDGDDATLSVMEDGFVALPAASGLRGPGNPIFSFLFASVPPPGRLVDAELFRPPTSPSL